MALHVKKNKQTCIRSFFSSVVNIDQLDSSTTDNLSALPEKNDHDSIVTGTLKGDNQFSMIEVQTVH